MKHKDLPLFSQPKPQSQEKRDQSLTSRNGSAEKGDSDAPDSHRAILVTDQESSLSDTSRNEAPEHIKSELEKIVGNIGQQIEHREKLRQIEQEKEWERRKQEGIQLFAIKDEKGLKPYRVPLMLDQVFLFVPNRSTKKSKEIGSARVIDARTGQVATFNVIVGKTAARCRQSGRKSGNLVGSGMWRWSCLRVMADVIGW